MLDELGLVDIVIAKTAGSLLNQIAEISRYMLTGVLGAGRTHLLCLLPAYMRGRASIWGCLRAEIFKTYTINVFNL